MAGDLASIDQAMRWGFNWEMGPFQMWDELGVGPVASRMERDGLAVPAWVRGLAARGGAFYAAADGRLVQAGPGGHRPVPEKARSLPLQRLEASGKRLFERPGATFYDLDDGVAYLDFHAPRQAIGAEAVGTLEALAEGPPAGFRGLVLSSHVQPNFCVGADLALMLSFAESGAWERLDQFIRSFQWALLGVKRLSWPVVVAPYGRTLGGGVELVLAGHRVVAAAESYLGLVETGAGLIPAAGGCKEMLLRAMEGLPGGVAGLLERSRGGAPSLAPAADPNAPIRAARDAHIGDGMLLTFDGEAQLLRLALGNLGVRLQPVPRRCQVDEVANARAEQGVELACGLAGVLRSGILPREKAARVDPVRVCQRAFRFVGHRPSL